MTDRSVIYTECGGRPQAPGSATRTPAKSTDWMKIARCRALAQVALAQDASAQKALAQRASAFGVAVEGADDAFLAAAFVAGFQRRVLAAAEARALAPAVRAARVSEIDGISGAAKPRRWKPATK